MLVLAGCGPVQGGPEGPLDTFIAFASDFEGYTRWESFSLQSTAVPNDVHATGRRTLYLSRRPPKGSTAFPVGTLMVKALPGVGRAFARVKRGGGYNPGAPGWEWFELQHVTLDEVIFVWRGVGPPSGEGYGGDPDGCNTCHSTAPQNDTVLAPDLRLSKL